MWRSLQTHFQCVFRSQFQIYGLWIMHLLTSFWNNLIIVCQQRPPFFSYKMGLLSAVRQALKLSAASFIFSALFVVLLPNQRKSSVARQYFSEHFIFYIGNFAVFLSWELILHLHKVCSSLHHLSLLDAIVLYMINFKFHC